MAALTSRMLIANVLIGAMIHCPVYADEAPAAAAAPLAFEAPMPADTHDTPFGGAAIPIPSAALEPMRGGAESSTYSESILNGAVSDNQAANLSTGANLVSDSSFAGASGFATVIQNSGNNVLIQNSTIVNVQVK